MNRKIERGNNIDLTNLLTRLRNVFPHEQPANATLHQALIAATAHVTQRDVPRSYKHDKNKCKHHYEQGEPEPWKRVLRAVNGLKSEVGGFRRLLVEHGIMHEDRGRKDSPAQQ
jgi:hypothetical protein